MDKNITIVTHNGTFHSDDLFAVAALMLFLEGKSVAINIVRTRDPEEISKGDFVVDVGGVYDESAEKFDHHQADGAGVRENGVSYASFGLVWKKYGSKICNSKEVGAVVDETLVQPIDYCDNKGCSLAELAPGIYPYTIDRIVSVSNDFPGSGKDDNDSNFFELVSWAKKIILGEAAYARAVESSREEILKAYNNTSDKRIIVLDEDYLWCPIICNLEEPLFVVHPDGKSGNWNVRAVGKGKYVFEARKNLPKAWAGLRNDELSRVSGVPDAIFCHNGLFFAVAKSREGALALARKAL